MKDFKLIYENFKNFEQKTEKDRALDQVKRLQPLLNETALDWYKHDRLQYFFKCRWFKFFKLFSRKTHWGRKEYWISCWGRFILRFEYRL